MIPLGFGFNENQRHQNCISQDASVTGFKRKVRNPGPEDHIRLHFFEPGLRTFLTYSTLLSVYKKEDTMTGKGLKLTTKEAITEKIPYGKYSINLFIVRCSPGLIISATA